MDGETDLDVFRESRRNASDAHAREDSTAHEEWKAEWSE